MLNYVMLLILSTNWLSWSVLCDGDEGNDRIGLNSPEFWLRIAIVFALLLISALMAGLTIGLLSLDSTYLRILKTSGSERQKRYAEIVEPIRKKGHLLLSTLLITNMLANESLPIFLHDILDGGWQAVVVSTALIVLFAEYLPY